MWEIEGRHIGVGEEIKNQIQEMLRCQFIQVIQLGMSGSQLDILASIQGKYSGQKMKYENWKNIDH